MPVVTGGVACHRQRSERVFWPTCLSVLFAGGQILVADDTDEVPLASVEPPCCWAGLVGRLLLLPVFSVAASRILVCEEEGGDAKQLGRLQSAPCSVAIFASLADVIVLDPPSDPVPEPVLTPSAARRPVGVEKESWGIVAVSHRDTSRMGLVLTCTGLPAQIVFGTSSGEGDAGDPLEAPGTILSWPCSLSDQGHGGVCPDASADLIFRPSGHCSPLELSLPAKEASGMPFLGAWMAVRGLECGTAQAIGKGSAPLAHRVRMSDLRFLRFTALGSPGELLWWLNDLLLI